LAVLTFDHVEGEYFAGTVSADALRQAWREREAAERALEAAHLGHPHPSNDLLTALYRG
jgi:predicted aconitase